MRSSIFASILVLVACQKSPGSGDDMMGPDADMGGETAAFTITSTDLTLHPGDQITKCYYFHTPNTAAIIAKRWTSHMTPGSHHMIVFGGSAGQPADGTIDDCGGSGQQIPVWLYAAQTPDQDMTLPTDDGHGKPLGMNIAANMPGYIQMHYLNSTDGDLTVHVSLSAYAYAVGTLYTPTAAYVTYNQSISIPPMSTGTKATQTCNVPANLSWWTVSTHSHKQSVHTELRDGTSVVFSSDTWEHPGSKNWMTMPFYTFTSGKFTYECTYDNPTNNTIVDGQSATTNEMCMGTGYVFPQSNASFCLDSMGPF
jgi:hypothetical protein